MTDMEKGSDELLRERGVWDDVVRAYEDARRRERDEEQRTANAEPVDDGGDELVEQ
jgi:hypothetical protein